MKSKLLFATLAILVLASSLCSASDNLAKDLAGITFSNGWKAAGDAAVYDAKNLFELVDGEAELFFPYGFKQTIAVTYVSASSAEEKIEAEVYELGTPLDAFGVYSNYRDAQSKIEAIGTEGFIGTTQAMFFQDRFFAKLRLAGKRMGDRELLKAATEAISRILPPNKQMPEEPALLKIPGAVPQTERYVAQSVLGYDFFTMGVTADVIVAKKTCTLFVIIGITPKDAEDTLGRFISHLEQSKGRYRWEEAPKGRILLAVDPLQKGVVATCVGSYVVGVAKLTTPKEGLSTLAQLRDRVLSNQ